MGLESFLFDKLIGLVCFIGAALFFYAGVSAFNFNFIITSAFLILGAICIVTSKIGRAHV
jgi:hypothetical protein